jgi:hypothetical protein
MVHRRAVEGEAACEVALVESVELLDDEVGGVCHGRRLGALALRRYFGGEAREDEVLEHEGGRELVHGRENGAARCCKGLR